MPRRRSCAVLFALCAGVAPAAPADILRLRDGSCYYGVRQGQSPKAVIFRVSRPNGQRQERRFPLTLVESIEAGPIEPPDPRRDAIQRTVEALELLTDGREKAALRSLQSVVREARGAELAACEALVERRIGAPLPRLMADLRLRLAKERSDDGVFKLSYATPYEADALGESLRELQAQTLETGFDGRRLMDWVADRGGYDKLRPGARELARDARLTAAIVAARLRFDPTLKKDRDARTHAVRLRDDLARLVSHIRALPGFTALDQADRGDDPTLAEAERLKQMAAQEAGAKEKEATEGPPAEEPQSPEKPEPNEPAPQSP
ncbi:MAG: hypothetical protein KDA32_06170 [Phycisphaerales bacterium]|nr:hypothetical protein [Phycisphaerales bacterium]